MDPKDAPKPTSRAKKVATRVLIGVVATPVVLVGFLHTPPGEAVLRARVEQRLGERVSTKATVGGLSFSLVNGIRLENVSILGNDKTEAIHVDSILVVPAIKKSLGGGATLEALSVHGVRVGVRGKEDGTTNLTGVFLEKKGIEHLVIEKVDVGEVAFTLTKPDGTKVALEGVGLKGAADVKPPQKTFAVDLELSVASLAYEKPGTKVAVQKLGTKAHVKLDAGAGDVTLGPTQASLVVNRDGKAPYPIELGLPPVAVSLAPGELKVATEALKVAAISLVSAKAEVRRTPEGDLNGNQKVELTTLKVDAEQVNVLAGKKVLAGDVTVDVTASGPPEKLVVGTKVTTPGGVVDLRATVDAKQKSLDASLTTRDLDVNRIVAIENVPEVKIGALAVTAAGKGQDKASADVGFTVHLEKANIKKIPLDRLDAKGTYRNGTLTVDSLELDALGQEVRGKVHYTPDTKTIAADVSTKGSLGVTLGALRQAGVKTPSSPLLASVAIARPVKLRVDGALDKSLTVHLDDVTLGVAAGTVHATGTVGLVAGDPAKGEKRFAADHVDANLELSSVSLDRIGKARGKPLPVSGTVSGKVHVSGSAAAPDADFSLAAHLADGAGHLTIDGTSRGGALDANVALRDRSGHDLLKTHAKGHIAQASLSPNAPLSLSLDVPKRPLSDFAPLLSAEAAAKLPNGTAELHAEVHGTLAKPTGDVHVIAEGQLVKALAPASQKADVTLHVEPSGRGTAVTAKGEVTLGEGVAPLSLVAKADVAGPLTQAKTADVKWSLDASLPETKLASLPLPAERKEGLSGAATLSVHAEGNRRDVAADVKLGLRGVTKGAVRDLDADVEAHLDDAHTTAKLDAKLHGAPVLTARAEAAVPGKELLVKKLDGADPAIDVRLDVPKTSLATFSPMAPEAATVMATIALKGHAKSPDLNGKIEAEGLRTLAGEPATTTLSLDGNLDELRASLGIGTGITVSVKVPPRTYLEAKKNGGTVPIAVAVTAPKAPLVKVLPALPELAAYKVEGSLSSDLAANLELRLNGDERTLEKVDTRGALTVEGGAFRVPGSSRKLDQVSLVLRGKGSDLAIESLEAHEHDREKADRRVSAHGNVSLPTRAAELYLDARDMLVFGGNFGQADAPRASLTGKLSVHAELAPKVKRIDVHVDSLELSAPDRFARAHQQEAMTLGDVVDLGASSEVGKLTRSRPPEPPKPEGNPAASEDKGPAEKTLEVHVHVPNPIHVKQKPLDLYAKGEVVIERTTAGRTLSGKLVCEKGSLLIGGVEHTLDHGEVRMTNEGPFLDLHFAHQPHVAALRDFTTNDGTALYAHMIGPFGKQKISFSGTSDGLFETLSMNGGGRTRVLSTAESPASQTAQLPTPRELRLTAYMAANLPHLAFLNRVSTKADPNQGRTYGRFYALEAERYSQDGTRRLRVTSRSPVIGQSDGEVEYDLLFQNSAQTVSGVGLLGGTRAGGGPAIFWEWTSKE